MSLKMFGRFAACLLVCGIVLTSVPSHAVPPVNTGVLVGQLNCDMEGNWSFFFGSVRKLDCTYANNKGASYHYLGRISRYGLDIGYLRGGKLVWNVLAPTFDFEPAGLAGDYIGVAAGVSAGSGGEANLLIGGSGRSVSLQPVSGMSTKGVNLAAGVAGISLQYQP